MRIEKYNCCKNNNGITEIIDNMMHGVKINNANEKTQISDQIGFSFLNCLFVFSL
jgi:hypothetical protein